MPRYFMHIDDRCGRETDEHGHTYIRPALAIGEAARMAGELVRNEAVAGATDIAAIVHVEDAAGHEIARVELSVFEPANPV